VTDDDAPGAEVSGDEPATEASSADRVTPSRHRRILWLAVPAIGTLIADPLLGAVDTAVAGRLGSAELGALGLAVSLLAAGTWVFNFLVFGTTTTVAHAMGRGDHEAAGRRVAHAGIAALVLGVVAGIAVYVLAAPLITAFDAVEELVEPAVAYLRVRAFGVPFLLLAYVGHGAFRGVGNTRTPLLIVVAANILNGVLNVVLVFVFGFGLDGIAAATVAAEIASVIGFALLIRRAGLPLGGHGLPSRAQVTDLVVVSRDLFLRTGGLLAGFLAITAAAARADADVAAAHQVIWQVFILVSFLMDGFAIAAQSMVGSALGAGDREEARATGRALIGWGIIGGGAIGIVLWAAQVPITRIFTSEPEVLALIGTAWALASLMHVLNGLVFVLDGVAMGAADFRYLRTWTMAAAVVAGVMAQIGVSLGAGLLWLWACVGVMMAVRGASLAVRIRGTRWLDSDLAR
jgi:putative MATE family efflux protein